MKQIMGVLIAGVMLCMFSQTVMAQTASASSKTVTLNATDVVDGDYFTAGENVIVSGQVKGDVYAVGGQLLIDGQIDGDIIAAGGSITISGEVAGNVRVVGGRISVDGVVGKNLTLMGGDIILNPNTQLSGNVVVAGGNVMIAAPIPGSLKAAAGNLTISSSIGGSADMVVGQLTLTPKASIAGDVTYRSENPASIAPEATISGALNHLPPHTPPPTSPSVGEASKAIGRGVRTVFTGMSFVLSLVLGLIFIGIFPAFSNQARDSIIKRPWVALGWGMLVLIVMPIILLFLFITLLGIPLALFLGTAYAFVLYLSRLIVAYLLGSKTATLAKFNMGPLGQFALGLVVYYLFSFIPVVGPLFSILALIAGLGALTNTWYHIIRGR